MPRLHNKNISFLDEADTIILEQELLRNGRIKSTGAYKISDTIVDDRKIARIIPIFEDKHQSRNLIIMDDKDKILLEGVYFKRKCLRKALNIYSPTGFLLGTVKERYFKWSADYDILAANQKILFYARQEKNTNDYSIKFTQKADKELIAKMTKSPSSPGHIWYTITYLKHIPTLQKIFILCEVLSFHQKESSSFVSYVSSKIEDTICCPLYYDCKIKFFILCLLFPLVIVVYLIFILMFVSYFIGTLFTLLIVKYVDNDTDLSCAFTWPCRLCKNDHRGSEYCPCYRHTSYYWQIITAVIVILTIHIFLFIWILAVY
ncbi:uncharacterized protein [Mytilus edulis]|uniref:uncharacterized protein n=1 Tax=Mytilus edulis TaxID=6550 RepID=UPI0039EEBE48